MIAHSNQWSTLRSELAVLFQTAFGRSISEEYLDWRYINNGSPNLHFAISRNFSDLSASYSACPVRLIIGSTSFDTALSMTTMTHPSARGQGLFPALARELYAEMTAKGVHLVWGFPNANSHLPFIEKLGWTDIYEIPTLTLKVSANETGSFYKSELVVQDNEFSLDYLPIVSHQLIHVEKGKDYLLWRYYRNPLHRYQVFSLNQDGIAKAFVISKIYKGSVDLVDIQASTPEEAIIVLTSVINYWTASGVNHFQTWAPTHHFLHLVLERIGFRNDGPVTYFGGCGLGRVSPLHGWTSYKNWFIQMGDSDVF